MLVQCFKCFVCVILFCAEGNVLRSVRACYRVMYFISYCVLPTIGNKTYAYSLLIGDVRLFLGF